MTPAAAASTNLKATYSIAFGLVTIGRANVDARFTDRGYAAAIAGSTFGVVRLVSDASARLNGSGRLGSGAVSPNTYSLDTEEGGFHTQVRMGLSGGSVTTVNAIPDQVEADDRVPLTAGHKRNVVDPVGAFIVSLPGRGDPTGDQACNRTVRVFDGWQRYDVRLTYKETRHSNGAGRTATVLSAPRATCPSPATGQASIRCSTWQPTNGWKWCSCRSRERASWSPPAS